MRTGMPPSGPMIGEGCDRNGEGRDGCGRVTCNKCYPPLPQLPFTEPSSTGGVWPASKWTVRFLEQAKFIAQMSKDPSTKTGAVITDKHNRVVSQGYNGFARNVHDSEARLNDRAVKYKMILHAEVNAVIFANRDLEGCSLYVWPWAPCAMCASVIVQSGISQLCTVAVDRERADRWKDDFILSQQILAEAGVRVTVLAAETVR